MARVVSQALDELGNLFILKDDGTLEKRDPMAVLLWTKQTKQEPTPGNFVYANQVTLDIDDNVWLTYDDQLNIQVRNGTTGNVITEVLGTASGILVAQTGGDTMFALSTSRGLFHEINRSTKVLTRSFDLTVSVPNYTKGIFATEMASSLSGKIWFPALVGPATQDKIAAVIAFDMAGAGTFTCYPITADCNVPIIAISSDVTGKVYAATLHGSVFRYNEAVPVAQFDMMYEPVGPGGVINIVTFTDTDDLILVDDGTYAFAGTKTRTIKPGNGDILSSISSANVGTLTGDIMGYQHAKLTRINEPPPAVTPVVDSNKLDVWVKPNGAITFTGRPGFVVDALSVKCSLIAGPVVVGTVAPNADGSFSVTSAPGVANPAGEAVKVESINGAEDVITNSTSQPRAIPGTFVADFQTAGFIMTGVVQRLKAKITDGGVVVPSAPGVFPIFRIKNSDGNWFNGLNFVPDNGDYLAAAYDPDDQLWYVDVTIKESDAGTASFIIKDSPPYAVNLILIPEIAKESDLEAAIAILDELNGKVDIAFGAPAGQFTDPSTIGGFIFERLNDIQKVAHQLIRGIIGTRNVVVESILTDVDSQEVPKGSTPSIDITIYDQERRFPKDISGSQVFFRAKVNLASDSLAIDEPCEIIDGPGGHARAKLTSIDTATARRLLAQIVIIVPGTGTLVSPAFFLDIVDSVL